MMDNSTNKNAVNESKDELVNFGHSVGVGVTDRSCNELVPQFSMSTRCLTPLSPCSSRNSYQINEMESTILSKIFLVSLTDATITAPSVFMKTTASEISSEDKDLMLNRDLIEEVLFDRLSGTFPGAEPAFQYLLGCFRRASNEENNIADMDKNVKSELELSIKHAKMLAVSYGRIHLAYPDMFTSNSNPENSKVSPLVPLISTSPDESFLEELFHDDDFVGMDSILRSLLESLRKNVLKVSVLGNFQQPLKALLHLLRFPVALKFFLNHPWWIPEGPYMNGRVTEMASILGPFFHVSALPDVVPFKSEPDVGQYCQSSNSRGGLQASFDKIKALNHIVYDDLYQIVLHLIETRDSRDKTLQFLAEVISRNSSRWNTWMEPMYCASPGMLINLSAVMLKICQPFLDANLTRRDKIDLKRVFHYKGLDLRGLATLNASSGEVIESIDRLPQPDDVHIMLISEYFFITARILNLGLLKAFSDNDRLIEKVSDYDGRLNSFQAMEEQTSSYVASLHQELKLALHEKLSYQAQIIEDHFLLHGALSFYRVMVVWLVHLVGGSKMPLPASCPMEFASFPEHFVEDAMKMLIHACEVPGALGGDCGVLLDDFADFIIMFMASPTYIRNPYLRSKMVEVLHWWIPCEGFSGSAITSMLFEGHPLVLQYLVRNLLQVYVDIEFTGTPTQLDDKYFIRNKIAELLVYLWGVPSHQNALIEISKEQDSGLYTSFLDDLIGDINCLLDESLQRVYVLEERERIDEIQSNLKIIMRPMKLAYKDLIVLQLTSQKITAPLLLNDMVDRVASMLNFFLWRLVDPERGLLTLEGPRMFESGLKRVLKQIVRVYIHVAKGDTEPLFPVAISHDVLSYNKQLFSAAVDALGKLEEDPSICQNLIVLGSKTQVTASEDIGEIPVEYLDPIQCTLMKDPVILPSSRETVDRAVIERYIRKKKMDPYTGQKLTPEMLIPDEELKKKIQTFISRRDGENGQD